jgi:hypothetical protein
MFEYSSEHTVKRNKIKIKIMHMCSCEFLGHQTSERKGIIFPPITSQKYYSQIQLNANLMICKQPLHILECMQGPVNI